MKQILDRSLLPNHVALICDGNRRWARLHGLPDLQGHKKGFEGAFQLAKDAYKLGIKNMTFWMFSTENWNRSKIEVNYIMRLAHNRIKKVGNYLVKNKIKFQHIGRKDRLPAKLLKSFADLEERTRAFSDNYFNLAMDHGGRDELVRGIKKMVNEGILAKKITEESISNSLDTAEMPEVDLLIRTSGEQRTSGFLTWKSTYAELAFPKVHLPDFDIKELKKVLRDFQKRDRRFGGDSKKEDKKYKMVSKT